MESFVSELVLAQQAQGMEVFALVHGKPQPDDPDWLTRVPVQIRLLYAPLALTFRQALARVIDLHRPDVLHLHMPNVAVFWSLTLPSAKRLPWVVHWHSDVIVSPQSPLGLRLAYSVYRPFEQAVLERAERIIATSLPYLRSSEPLASWRYKCAAIPLGLPTHVPVQPDGATALPWQGGGLRLLSIGRLAHYKGFETLVRAVKSTPGVQLTIAGDGESMPALKALVADACLAGADHSPVYLLGAVSEAHKHALLASCDVFCLASRERTEAFGVVLLEAMAHGKPCMVADLPGSGMPWVIQAAAAGMHHLRVDDPAHWAQEILALQHRRQDLQQWGEQGRQGLKRLFSIEACAHAIQGQYTQHVLAGQVDEHDPLGGGDFQPDTHPHKVLVVIPARDEASTIAQVVSALQRAGWCEILVVDDQSQDETASLARAAGAQVISPALALGAWGAMQLGIRYAQAQAYQGVVTMDADGQHEVAELPTLLAQSAAADVVIGAHPQRVSPMRLLAWRWFRALTGLDLKDLTSGFRYYNRRAITALAGPEATLLDYQDIGVLILLQRAGLRLTEVPVMMHPRQAGQSRIFNSWGTVLWYMLSTTVLCLSRWKTRAPLTQATQRALRE